MARWLVWVGWWSLGGPPPDVTSRGDGDPAGMLPPAFEACDGRAVGMPCEVDEAGELVAGRCVDVGEGLACVPGRALR